MATSIFLPNCDDLSVAMSECVFGYCSPPPPPPLPTHIHGSHPKVARCFSSGCPEQTRHIHTARILSLYEYTTIPRIPNRRTNVKVSKENGQTSRHIQQ
ncbi:hypothetical protein BaRGS_00036786 [Batillaria attramentaria]|uniref:Uncharacterized protein n=1 Tax=Batillaria attramentaria TaxID=370345 RepID=A0ABD0JAH9_9CAEN